MTAPTVFQTPPYLVAYRRTFGSGKKFTRLDVPGGRIWLQSRGKSARRLEMWGAGIHDLGGVALQDAAAAPLLWQALQDRAREHDGVHLAQVAAGSPLVSLALAAGWKVQDAETCPVLDLPESYDAYVRGLGKNMREQIKRYPKRLEKQFKVQYELASTPQQVDVAMADLFRLHGKRWRERGQTGVLGLPGRRRFHRDVAQGFLKRDWLRLWTLRLDGEAACVLLNYAQGGKYWFFIGGFEPDLMRWSVGTCLFARVFETAIGEGATAFDFLRGEEEYKYRYGATDRHYKTLSWFAPTPRGRLLQRRVQLEESFMQKLHERFSAAGGGSGKTATAPAAEGKEPKAEPES